MVGDFEPKQAIEWAEKYFGRLKRGETEPEPVRTWEIEQQAETRMVGYADTRPTVRIRYHTVADAHREEPAFLVLASLLNGRTGRLYKSLVLEQKVATEAGAGVNGLKYDGFFELSGIAAEGHTPEEVEQALHKEVKVLQEQLVGDQELLKVKNQQLAGDFRRLRSKTSLMIQLLMYEALGDWENINKFSERIQAVTAEDVRAVARKYIKAENSNVAVYNTKAGGGSPGQGRGGPRRSGNPGPGGSQ